MALSLSSPVTGAAQTGLTTPGFVIVADTPPAINMKQWVVSSIAGTQPGVLAHTLSSPFFLSVTKPLQTKMLGTVNPSTGLLRAVPMNTYVVQEHKGVIHYAGQPASKVRYRLIIDAPAGSDTADPNSVRSGLSFFIGSVSQISAALGDLIVTGVW